MGWTDTLETSPTSHDVEVTNQTFFGNFNLTNFLLEYRIPAEIELLTVQRAVINALFHVNTQLWEFKSLQEADGVYLLADVPNQQLVYIPDPDDDQATIEVKEKVFHYATAVSCYAKGLLLPECITVDRKADAENQAKTSHETIKSYEEKTNEAISNILGEENFEVVLL